MIKYCQKKRLRETIEIENDRNSLFDKLNNVKIQSQFIVSCKNSLTNINLNIIFDLKLDNQKNSA